MSDASHKRRQKALVNVNQAQNAGRVAARAGLANDNGFCLIDPKPSRSSADGNIFVIGDDALNQAT